MVFTHIVQVIQASALLFGVVFAVIQIRHFRKNREFNASLELVHSIRTSEFARAIHRVAMLPDGLSKQRIEEELQDDIGLVYITLVTWESLGPLVRREVISLDVFDDYYSGPLLVSWRKLERYVKEFRQEIDRQTWSEWFQWLADQMKKREERKERGEQKKHKPGTPAYEEYKDWQPSKRE